MTREKRNTIHSSLLLAKKKAAVASVVAAVGSFMEMSAAEYLLGNAHDLSIMGTGVLNQDSIAIFLADRISSGLPINVFGDGTVKDGIGAHGSHIRPTLDLTHCSY